MAEDRRTPDATGPGREWERLALSRIAPGGPGSTDLAAWLARGSAVLLVVTGAWLIFAAARPLASPGPVEAPGVRGARGVEAPILGVARREELLSSISGTNWFDPAREMWSRRDLEVLAQREGDAPDLGEEPGGESGRTEDAVSAPGRETPRGLLNVTAVSELPETLAKAYANLELRGIRSRRDGTLVAMMGTVQSPTRPATVSYSAGETFLDEKFPEQEWRVVLIDGRGDRVFLRRAGTTVELSLFKRPGSVVSGEGGEDVDGVLGGVSREEIAAQLRAAGVSEEEIAELLRLASDGGDAPVPVPEVNGIDETLSELDGSESASGLQSILEMMSETRAARRPSTKEFAFPEVDTYRSTGGGHSIAGVEGKAGLVTLEDGSAWQLSARDAERVSRWGEAAPVSVYRGRGTGRPYVIVNEATKEFFEADHVVEGAPEDQPGGDVESADAGE